MYLLEGGSTVSVHVRTYVGSIEITELFVHVWCLSRSAQLQVTHGLSGKGLGCKASYIPMLLFWKSSTFSHAKFFRVSNISPGKLMVCKLQTVCTIIESLGTSLNLVHLLYIYVQLAWHVLCCEVVDVHEELLSERCTCLGICFCLEADTCSSIEVRRLDLRTCHEVNLLTVL